MDNQHKLIKGYRDLSQEEIDIINEIKTKAEEVKVVVDKVRNLLDKQYLQYEEDEFDALVESSAFHFHDSAKMDLQTGFMKLTRAVAQSTTF